MEMRPEDLLMERKQRLTFTIQALRPGDKPGPAKIWKLSNQNGELLSADYREKQFLDLVGADA